MSLQLKQKITGQQTATGDAAQAGPSSADVDVHNLSSDDEATGRDTADTTPKPTTDKPPRPPKCKGKKSTLSVDEEEYLV